MGDAGDHTDEPTAKGLLLGLAMSWPLPHPLPGSQLELRSQPQRTTESICALQASTCLSCLPQTFLCRYTIVPGIVDIHPALWPLSLPSRFHRQAFWLLPISSVRRQRRCDWFYFLLRIYSQSREPKKARCALLSPSTTSAFLSRRFAQVNSYLSSSLPLLRHSGQPPATNQQHHHRQEQLSRRVLEPTDLV